MPFGRRAPAGSNPCGHWMPGFWNARPCSVAPSRGAAALAVAAKASKPGLSVAGRADLLVACSAPAGARRVWPSHPPRDPPPWAGMSEKPMMLAMRPASSSLMLSYPLTTTLPPSSFMSQFASAASLCCR